VIEQIPSNQVISVERDTFPNLLATGSKVFGYLDTSYWLDIGNPAALVKASADLITGKIFSSATPAHSGDYLVAATAQIASDAVINNGSVIAGEVSVASNSQISGSIIGKGAKIGANCKIIDSIIAPAAQIPAGMLVISNYLGF
jgi:mannose-1-phosphate guanylyltransferase